MKKTLKNVTGVVVSYNTPDLMRQAYESIREFYPTLKIIIVDGSEPNNPCAEYVKSIASNVTKVYKMKHNIGHGKGMHFGIKKATTSQILVFDSDIIMRKPCIELMQDALTDNMYAVGHFENVCKDGFFHKSQTECHRIPYLHPVFMLLNKAMYLKYPPFIHHGSPCIRTMNAIHNERKSEEILKAFPIFKYIKHLKQGTRKSKPREFSNRSCWDPVSCFLSVITRRHPHRPNLYEMNAQSLLEQTDFDYEQILLNDDVGRGVPYANSMLHSSRNRVSGEYVFILDDDDIITDPNFVSDMKEIVKKHNPDVIMIRMLIKDRLYPTDKVWGKIPLYAHIGMCNFVVRKELYLKHSNKFCVKRGADFNFISAVFSDKPKIFWQDKIYSKTLVVSHGKPEPNFSIPHTEPTKINGSVTAITCTGDRPEAFKLCVQWMERQTLQPRQWIVVDDGVEPLRYVPSNCLYIRREPNKNDPPHTLSLNMIEALDRVSQETVVIFEDDDWYSAGYIAKITSFLPSYDLVGVGNLAFYNVRDPGWSFRGKSKQPPLYQTAFRSTLVPFVQDICFNRHREEGLTQKGLLDIAMWQRASKILDRTCVVVNIGFDSPQGFIKQGSVFYEPFPPFILRRLKTNKLHYQKKAAKRFIYYPPNPIAVGIKQMPGRRGLTQAQKHGGRFYKCDKDYQYLTNWIGEDVQYYKGFKNG